jgi:hypothetical protein
MPSTQMLGPDGQGALYTGVLIVNGTEVPENQLIRQRALTVGDRNRSDPRTFRGGLPTHRGRRDSGAVLKALPYVRRMPEPSESPTTRWAVTYGESRCRDAAGPERTAGSSRARRCASLRPSARRATTGGQVAPAHRLGAAVRKEPETRISRSC